MTLGPGARLGAYELKAAIGAGGMGEVYRARDSRLGRDVALKILPDAFAHDPDRLMRFEREARSLATLNHPHIAQVYGIEDSGDTRALVMELVEGEDLSARLARGPMPVDEALPVARQVADALEAAHRAGVIHRDLKPANIRIRADGTAKVLDFGLAKPVESGTAPTTSGATITSPAVTLHGVVLGTAAYMAPEQAKGKPVDERADTWAFGCVLYEMLTGARAFMGDDVTETMTAVLRDPPDWERLPADTPAGVRVALRACLEKDPRHRLRDAGDFAVLLRVTDNPAPAASSRAVRWRAIAAVGVLLVAAIAAFLGARVLDRPERRVASLGLALPPDADVTQIAAIPDGSGVVFTGGGGSRLFVRALDALEPIEIARGSAVGQPFVSPSGRWVGYTNETTRLMKVPITGGSPSLVTRLDGRMVGATWLDDDTIVVATVAAGGLQRVTAAGGGAPVAITTPEPGLDHTAPVRMPDGRSVLFTVSSRAASAGVRTARLDLASGAVTTVFEGGGSQLRLVAEDSLAYLARGQLMAVPFDRRTSSVRPEATPRDTGIRATAFDVFADGSLIYSNAATARALAWVDRAGQETAIAVDARPYQYLQISPDGTRVALAATDGGADLWIMEVASSSMTRLTFDPATDTAPVWTPDGRRLVFASNRETGVFNLWWQAADGTGTPERLTDSSQTHFPTAVTPDGRQAIFWVSDAAGRDLMMVALDGSRRVTPLLQSPETDDLFAAVSPDGRWLAFESNSSGLRNVYVRPFPDLNRGLWQVSTTGGRQPSWSGDGSGLFFFDGTGALTRAPVAMQAGAFRPSAPVRLFEPHYYGAEALALVARTYDATRDGSRFIVVKPDAGGRTMGSADVILVQHWIDRVRGAAGNAR